MAVLRNILSWFKLLFGLRNMNYRILNIQANQRRWLEKEQARIDREIARLNAERQWFHNVLQKLAEQYSEAKNLLAEANKDRDFYLAQVKAEKAGKVLKRKRAAV